MELAAELKALGFSLMDPVEEDVDDFIRVEKVAHSKYVLEHSDFFGERKEDILVNAFHDRRKMTFFKKLMWNGEIVGFMSYDQKEDKIDNVLIKIIDKAQNNGIGTWFLSNLKELSKEYSIPAYVVVIKTNPAQNLYKRMGFELDKEKDVFYYFKYTA